MAEFAVWSPIVSFLTLIQYTNGLVGAQGEMRTADDIINCTSELLIGVQCDFERLQDYLSRPRKRYAERQIDRTNRELEKVRKIVNVNRAQGTAKRQVNGICWLLKNKAGVQMSLAALHQYHITLSEIRLELALLESTMPWILDRSRPALDDCLHGNQHKLPTSQPYRQLLSRPSLTYGSNSFTTSSRYSDTEDLGSWLLQQRRDVVRIGD
ncbi:hypothetical protein AJ78_04882 [Emergomyces pasteurianus Ep9510]|uniref:Prion-inhibition and propagation HeLo domain-containing protein n=1 Tax=Emergomyces pasteurianus Ep9510 TaxID=1447872 RepID=A0A1J9PFT1_9EURO|nr:hypothetical protein AJ78_04882 [Emergomyces pasteurianus Ep9510]